MAVKCLAVLLIATLLNLGSCEQRILSNDQSKDGILRRFNVDSNLQQVLATAEAYDLDVWHATESVVDIYSPPNGPYLPKELANLPHNVTYLPAVVKMTSTVGWNVTTLGNTSFHDYYHPLYEAQAFLTQLAGAYPNITSLTSLGQSAEGREILGLKISTGPYSMQEKKKRPAAHNDEKLAFVIMGAQHAREWVAHATATYLAHALVANASEHYSLSTLLAHFDFYIVPIPNPDGYDYTWKTDRYWYKNRQIISPYTKCIGLDMNRNWGYKWKAQAIDRGLTGSRDWKPRQPTNPCSHWYPGTRPFESLEVNNIANWISTLPNVVGFLSLRSYGQMLSSPYSYTCNRLPKDAEDQVEAAHGASSELSSVHGTPFQVGSLCSNLYPAPGNILDWMYAREAIKYSYVAHLRDTGTYGFSLPENWLRPTGEETAGLIDYLAKFIAKHSKST